MSEGREGRGCSPLDRLVMELDGALRTLHGRPRVSERPPPDQGLEEGALTPAQRDHIARLMRINHSGEVCAQALYQGQALTAQLPTVRAQMERAAVEESDHLAWCERRIQELGGRKSLLNPLWYVGSLSLGAAAGLAGDRWSLGFVAETERQVEAHLTDHLAQLPEEDHKSRAVLQQMREDEGAHARAAVAGGAARLPLPLRLAMKFSAKLMTTSVYRL